MVGILDKVFFAREGAPTVDTTQTHLLLVDAEVGDWTWIDVGRMEIALIEAFVEAFDGVVER